jgi:aryl-alcohol dehydrogenase-like predicted oxidoreductase
MEYRRLGSTGLKVPRIGLGCGNFGGIGSAPAFFGMGETEEQAFAIMDHAFDAGITLFDTANAYGGGRSESYIGRWLRRKGSQVREQLILSSKVFNPVGPGANDRGLSRRHILQQVDTSLARLGTDRLELYMAHEPDPETPIEETLDALNDTVQAGKVLYVGASNFEAWRLARALAVAERRKSGPFAFVQNSFSLLDRTAERELLPLCRENGVGFTAFSPLAGGWLTGKYRRGSPYPAGSRMTLRPEPYVHLQSAIIFDALTRLQHQADARGVAMSSLAMAWALHQPQVDALIIGPRTTAHVDEALAALDVALDDNAVATLSAAFPAGS